MVSLFDRLLHKAHVVTASDEMDCDIGIRDGRILALCLQLGPGMREIDAAGCVVTPGGVDATPAMQAKLRKVGTPDALAAVAILDIILRDEIGHVAIGNHWYRHLCSERGLEPVATYAALAKQYGAPRLKGPFNLDARRSAGFSEQELAHLTGAAQTRGPASDSFKQ